MEFACSARDVTKYSADNLRTVLCTHLYRVIFLMVRALSDAFACLWITMRTRSPGLKVTATPCIGRKHWNYPTGSSLPVREQWDRPYQVVIEVWLQCLHDYEPHVIHSASILYLIGASHVVDAQLIERQRPALFLEALRCPG